MSKELATRDNRSAVDARSPLLDAGTFGDMYRLAEAMARSKTLPQHLHGNAGDCLRVVEYAHRCGYSPFALADCTFLVGGKMGWEGKAIAAMVNASPRVVGSLRYDYDGKGKDRRVIVSGRLAGEAQDRTVDATVAMGLRDSKGARQRWETDEDQMLAYYGARRWARRHASEIILGLYTPDEILSGADEREMVDITPREAPPTEEHEVSETVEAEPVEAKPAKLKLIPLHGADGVTVEGEFTSYGEWLAGLEIAAKADPKVINGNWHKLTELANRPDAPVDVRKRAEALREQAPDEDEESRT